MKKVFFITLSNVIFLELSMKFTTLDVGFQGRRHHEPVPQ